MKRQPRLHLIGEKWNVLLYFQTLKEVCDRWHSNSCINALLILIPTLSFDFLDQILAVIVCQSVHRQNVARREVEMLRYERRLTAFLVIQSNWRVCIAKNQFANAKSQTILIQSYARMWAVVSYLRQCQKNVTAATSQWRGYSQRMKFKQTRRGMQFNFSVHIILILC